MGVVKKLTNGGNGCNMSLLECTSNFELQEKDV